MDSSSPSIPWKILVIDDDRDDFAIIQAVLASSSPERYALEWAGTFAAGQRMLRSCLYDAVILDYSLGEKNGIDLLRELDAANVDFPFILLTGYGNPDVFMDALEAGAAYTLTKNELSGSLLKRGIQFAVKLKREEVALRKSNQALEASSKAIIAQEAVSREIQQRTVEILASIEDGVFGLDREWRFTYVNPRAAQNVGYTPEQLAGKIIWEVFPAVLASEHERVYRQVMEDRCPAGFDFQGILTEKFYNIRVFPSAEGITVYWMDITGQVQARKQIEQELDERERVARRLAESEERLQEIYAALLESEEKFRAAFDNAAIGLAITNPDGRFVEANPTYCAITGYPKDELLQLHFTQLVHPDDLENNMAVTNQMIRGEIVDFVLENRCVRKDGQVAWVRKSVSPVRTADGALHWNVALVEDITERKHAKAARLEAELALRESEVRLRQQNKILQSINRIFQQAISTESEEDLGDLCLTVAEEITQSKFGFLCEINRETGRLDVIAISDPGWDACRISDATHNTSLVTGGFTIQGIYGRVIQDGKGFYTNNPSEHPDRIGTPAGHPALTAFLGVPLFYGGEVIGMIGLGNRPGGYDAETLEDVEALAPAIVQAFMSRRAEEGRIASEASLRVQNRLIELSYEPVIVWDLDGGIISWNEGCEHLYGYTRREAVGQVSHSLLQTVFPVSFKAFMAQLQAEGQWTGEILHTTKDGQSLILESRQELVEVEGRRLVLETNHDITGRKQAEQALRKSNDDLYNERNLLLAVMEALPVGLAIYDNKGGVIQANAEFEDVWGSPRPPAGSVEEYEAYQAWWAETGRPVLPEEWAAAVAVQHGKTTTSQFFEIQRFDGKRGFVINSGAPVRDGEGRLIGATVAIMDITERIRAEKERNEAQIQSEIQRRLLENREQERQEIARDLHDGPVQLLSGTMFQLQVAREMEQDPTLKVELDQAALNIKATVRELREMMNELRPPAIIRFGLSKSIRIHLEDFREKHPEIRITPTLFEDDNVLSEQARLALFRVYQESLNNIVKHAGASKVSVRLTRKGNQVRLQIHDDGKGFDLSDSLVTYTQRGHYGLAGMKERAEAIGGSFSALSQVGKGTTITVTVSI